ncbi:IlvE Branched-chain amino acid aminotransferase/4-amino-4-deoxychorismate lyase [Candidatus Nanopelagicaceae bacterium]
MTVLKLDSHGFPKASGIFETIKTVKGAPIALGRHMRRALESALELGISIPSEEFIRDEMVRVLAHNPHDIGRLRICFGREIFHITHDEYVEHTEPARLNFYSQTVIGAVHKLFPYDYRFALIEAANDEGYHDSVLFNEKNEITETAVANLAFYIGGEWVTPPITSGILPGVIRAIAIEECGVRVRPIHVSEIPEVESGFMLSSLRIAQPISHIGDMKLKIGDASRALEEQIHTNCKPVSVG